MKRKFLLSGMLAALLAAQGFSQQAQQITKFAVVDTARVFRAFNRDSSQVRNYEAKKSQFQEEINRYTEELQQLNQRKNEAQLSGDTYEFQRLSEEINQKAAYLREYSSARNAELETMKNSMQRDDAFYKRLYRTLEKVAEAGGYSMIMSLQQADAVLWYSPSVDITDEVISRLK